MQADQGTEGRRYAACRDLQAWGFRSSLPERARFSNVRRWPGPARDDSALALAPVRGEYRVVSGREGIGIELVGPNPGQRGVLDGDRVRAAGRERGDEPVEPDGDLGIGVECRRQGVADDEVAAEFLADFPPEGVARRFTRFDFSTGEFPEQAKVLVRRPLRDEDTAVALDQGADDLKRSG